MLQPIRKKHEYTDGSILEAVARIINKEIMYIRHNPNCPPKVNYLCKNIPKITSRRLLLSINNMYKTFTLLLVVFWIFLHKYSL